jgi:hypothetical protein
MRKGFFNQCMNARTNKLGRLCNVITRWSTNKSSVGLLFKKFFPVGNYLDLSISNITKWKVSLTINEYSAVSQKP